VQNTPIIRQLEIEVTSTREARRAYTGSNRETIAILQDAYDRAVLAIDQATQVLEVTMLRYYSEHESLVNRGNTLSLELTQSELQLETALHNFALGRITYHEVEQARFAIFVTEQEIELLCIQIWGLAFLLENPAV